VKNLAVALLARRVVTVHVAPLLKWVCYLHSFTHPEACCLRQCSVQKYVFIICDRWPSSSIRGCLLAAHMPCLKGVLHRSPYFDYCVHLKRVYFVCVMCHVCVCVCVAYIEPARDGRPFFIPFQFLGENVTVRKFRVSKASAKT